MRFCGYYLYNPTGSKNGNWRLKLQYDENVRHMVGGRAKLDVSLGTPVRNDAEAQAAPHIHLHKRLLATADQMRDPGSSLLHDAIEVAFESNGGRILA